MIKRKLKKDDYLLIAVNLLPVVAVWFCGWDPKMMFLVYVSETLIAGGFTILKMFITTQVKKKDLWQNNGASSYVSGYFFILFFILHYGFFVSIQMFLFFSASGMSDGTFLNSLKILGNVWKEPTLYALLGFILMYGTRVMNEFILTGQYREISLSRLMFSPYMRIFIQQFVVILGSMILSFGGGKIFMLVFVLIKTWFDVFLDFERALAVYEKKSIIEKEINKQSPEMQEKINRIDDLLGR